MTVRHAPQHADYVTRKSSHSLSSNRSRNPWMQDRHHRSTNTLSSTTSLQGRTPVYYTHYTLSGPGPHVHQGNAVEQRLQYYQAHPTSVRSMTMPRLHQGGSQVYPMYVERAYGAPSVRTNPTSLPRTRTPRYCDHVPGLNSGFSTSRTSSDRPNTPVSLSTTDGIIDPCGGHCRTFERCCRYLLQILFMIGIIVGVSLVLAAYWLQSQHRGGDQTVLIYIGILMTSVCSLLLIIQCSVESEVKRRKRHRRANSALITRSRNLPDVPLRELGNGNRLASNNNTRIVEELPQSNTTFSQVPLLPQSNTCCQVPLLGPTYQYEAQRSTITNSCDETTSQSENGIPWWRRRELEVTSKIDNNII